MRTPLAGTLTITPLLLLAACAGPLNTESCIGVGMRSDSLSGVFCPAAITESSIREVPEEAAATVNQRLAPVYAGGGVVPAADAKPSIVSLDRGNWGATDMRAYNDLSAHQPRYTKNVLLNDTARRTRGEYPTAASAVDTGTGAGMDRQIQEAFVAPVAAAADVVLLVPRMVVAARPWQTTRTGLEPYERQPRMQTIVPAPLTFVNDEPVRTVAPAIVAPESTPGGVQVQPTGTGSPAQPAPSSTVPPTATPPGPESSRPPERKAPWERSTVRPGTRSEPKKD